VLEVKYYRIYLRLSAQLTHFTKVTTAYSYRLQLYNFTQWKLFENSNTKISNIYLTPKCAIPHKVYNTVDFIWLLFKVHGSDNALIFAQPSTYLAHMQTIYDDFDRHRSSIRRVQTHMQCERLLHFATRLNSDDISTQRASHMQLRRKLETTNLHTAVTESYDIHTKVVVPFALHRRTWRNKANYNTHDTTLRIAVATEQ
jgi:hypothetical protein